MIRRGRMRETTASWGAGLRQPPRAEPPATCPDVRCGGLWTGTGPRPGRSSGARSPGSMPTAQRIFDRLVEGDGADDLPGAVEGHVHAFVCSAACRGDVSATTICGPPSSGCWASPPGPGRSTPVDGLPLVLGHRRLLLPPRHRGSAREGRGGSAARPHEGGGPARRSRLTGRHAGDAPDSDPHSPSRYGLTSCAGSLRRRPVGQARVAPGVCPTVCSVCHPARAFG